MPSEANRSSLPADGFSGGPPFAAEDPAATAITAVSPAASASTSPSRRNCLFMLETPPSGRSDACAKLPGAAKPHNPQCVQIVTSAGPSLGLYHDDTRPRTDVYRSDMSQRAKAIRSYNCV